MALDIYLFLHTGRVPCVNSSTICLFELMDVPIMLYSSYVETERDRSKPFTSMVSATSTRSGPLDLELSSIAGIISTPDGAPTSCYEFAMSPKMLLPECLTCPGLGLGLGSVRSSIFCLGNMLLVIFSCNRSIKRTCLLSFATDMRPFPLELAPELSYSQSE